MSSYFEEIKKDLLERYSVSAEKILSIDGAYQMYVRNRHSSENGHTFCSPWLVLETFFSEGMQKKMLTDMQNMIIYFYLQERYKDLIAWYKNSLHPAEQQGQSLTLKSHTPI